MSAVDYTEKCRCGHAKQHHAEYEDGCKKCMCGGFIAEEPILSKLIAPPEAPKFKAGTVKEFLNLSDEEEAEVERRVKEHQEAPEPPAPEAEEKTVTLTYKEYIHSLERLRDWALVCEEMAKALRRAKFTLSEHVTSDYPSMRLLVTALAHYEKMTGKKP